MSSPDLRIDLSVLSDAGSNLTTVSNEFNNAPQHGQDVASLVGYKPLANAIRDFSTKWNEKRQELQKAVAALAQATTEIANSFESTDSTLQQSLSVFSFDTSVVASTPNAVAAAPATTPYHSTATSDTPSTSPSAATPLPAMSVSQSGGLMPTMRELTEQAQARLQQLDNELANLKAQLEALESQIGQEMAALQIRAQMDMVMRERDIVSGLLNAFPVGASAPVTTVPGAPVGPAVPQPDINLTHLAKEL